MSEVKAQYDPTKAYRWDTDQPFTLSGVEFGVVYNSLVKKKMELLKELQAIEILEYKLKLAVEEGIATEFIKTEQPAE